ncbi:copper amine oxidase N-terminal domain-containing protein [Sporosarcina oncorhynchi]|uniref:Copper amine oxidase N-terminal domain-containing protein n=1 Tax=Sporosarcina oncorhynchi TaxID=3056444 RepID=A0ABZ0L319_9BACL|nr:copper amine oxidase N-terminal domain-containing protein [Sporosarcina sp. T2O-4]WOV86865.1 copper amine oxidase N-terminal domain-containing protein [Sporosarcina sp. T2O-4]
MAKWIYRMIVCFAAVLVIGIAVQQEKASASSADSLIKIYLNTNELDTKTPAKIKNGLTFVPVRAVFESLGMKVVWEPKKQLLTVKDSERTITLIVGEKTAKVNGKTVALQAPAENIDGALQVPLQFVGDATGAIVYWDPYVAEVSILTTKFMKDNNMNKAELDKQVKEYLAAKAKEVAAKKKEDPKPKVTKKPKAVVDLNKLNGMYAGFRSDVGGYECGGMCWEMYTFLPNKKVLIGPPANGGPETIDCKKEKCLSYSISKGQLKLSNGKTMPIKKTKNGFLEINGIALTKVEPVPKGTTFDNTYTFMGYSGLIGVTPAANSWTYNLTLHKNGKFDLSGISIGSLAANSNPSAHMGHSGIDEKGKYKIQNNTISMTGSDGKVHKALFFIHDADMEDIQVGLRNYYVK